MVDISKFNSDESRRSVLKKSALATAGAGILGSVTGSAAAQEGDGDEAGIEGQGKALVFQPNFHANARFTFASDVVNWQPNVPEVTDNIWSDYNTRFIRYLNTNERVPIFVAEEADVGPYDEDLGFVPDQDDDANQPQVYDMNREFALWQDSSLLVTVNFSPLGEDEEDDVLDNEDWWQDEIGTNGTATAGGDNATAGNGGNTTGGNQSG